MYHFKLYTYVIFSIHSLRFWCEMYEIKNPEIVIAQALYESGHGRCKNCALTEKNNVFGFTDSKGFLTFKHWTESVKFYSDWQKKYYTGENYYEFLRKRWGAPNMQKYIKTLKQIGKVRI